MLLTRGGVLDTVLKGSGQHPEGGRQGKAFLPEDMQQVSAVAMSQSCAKNACWLLGCAECHGWLLSLCPPLPSALNRVSSCSSRCSPATSLPSLTTTDTGAAPCAIATAHGCP